MSKKPFNPVIPDYTPRSERNKEKEEVKLNFKPCLHCGKEIGEGYYGQWEGGGVCSKTCNTAQSMKPKFPPPSPEFLQQLEQQDGLEDGFENDV